MAFYESRICRLFSKSFAHLPIKVPVTSVPKPFKFQGRSFFADFGELALILSPDRKRSDIPRTHAAICQLVAQFLNYCSTRI